MECSNTSLIKNSLERPMVSATFGTVQVYARVPLARFSLKCESDR